MSTKAKVLILSVVALALVIILLIPMLQQEEVPLHRRISDYEGALQEAREAGKPVFLEFYAEY